MFESNIVGKWLLSKRDGWNLEAGKSKEFNKKITEKQGATAGGGKGSKRFVGWSAIKT